MSEAPYRTYLSHICVADPSNIILNLLICYIILYYIFFLTFYMLHYFNYFNYFLHYKYFYDSKATQAKYLTSLDVVFNDADVKSHYDHSNSERQ